MVVQMLDSGAMPSLSLPSVDTRASVVSHGLPSLDAGFRHPCRNDGTLELVNNDEGWRTRKKSKFHAKAQRRKERRSPLRALRETSFFGNDGKIPTRPEYFCLAGLVYNGVSWSLIVSTVSVTAIKLSTNGVQGLPCEVSNYL